VAATPGARAAPAQRAVLADAATDAPPLFDIETVRDYHLRFANPNWESELQATGEDGNVKADLTVDGTVYEEIGARYKGLSTARVQGRKKPFNLSIDAFVPGQRLLGYDTINLNNGFADPSFVRESLTYGALRGFMPAPETAFVRLSVNGEYFALYLGVEQIERTFLDKWFPGSDGILIKADPPAAFGPRFDAAWDSAPEAAGGLAAEPSPQQIPGGGGLGADLTWKGEDLAAYKRSYEVKTASAGDEGYERLRELSRVLAAPVSAGGVSDAAFPEAIQELLDVDGALWYIAANNLFVNFDSYYFAHNYFLYWAEEDERFHLLIWDTNMSFGSFNFPGPAPAGVPLAQADPFHMSTDQARPLIRRLLAVPEFRADYLAHYRDLLNGAFDPAALEAAGAALQARIRPHVESDPNRLYDLATFDKNLREDITAGTGPRARTTVGVLKIAAERGAWLKGRADLQAPDHRLDAHSREPESPTAETGATVRVRFAGADEPAGAGLVYRVDDGPPAIVPLTQDGATWEGTIPAMTPGSDVAYYIRAAFADGRSAFHPPANLTRPWRYTVAGPDLPVVPGGDLVINELQADNETTIADAAGEFEDWAEVYNRGLAPIDLKGYYLAKDGVDPWAYALPDITLAPGERYLVWCDKDPDEGPDHAPFRLGKEGDSLRLSTKDATVDVVTFGVQAADRSHARRSDGAGDWIDCQHPTPRGSNRCDAPNTPVPSPTPLPTSSPTSRPWRVFMPLAQR